MAHRDFGNGTSRCARRNFCEKHIHFHLSRSFCPNWLCTKPVHYWGSRWGAPWRCYSNRPKRLEHLLLYGSLCRRTNSGSQASGWILNHWRRAVYSPHALHHFYIFKRHDLSIRKFLGISCAATVHRWERAWRCPVCWRWCFSSSSKRFREYRTLPDKFGDKQQRGWNIDRCWRGDRWRTSIQNRFSAHQP